MFFTKLEDTVLVEKYFELREKREADNEAFWALLSAKMLLSRFEIGPSRCLSRIEALLKEHPSVLFDDTGYFDQNGQLLRWQDGDSGEHEEDDAHCVREKIWKDYLARDDTAAQDDDTLSDVSCDEIPDTDEEYSDLEYEEYETDTVEQDDYYDDDYYDDDYYDE